MSAAHHLCIAFREDGQVDFFPRTDDAAELARRFARVIRMFVEHPSAVQCAAGNHCGVARHDHPEART